MTHIVGRPSRAPELDPQLPCVDWDGPLDKDGYGRWGSGRAGSQQAHRRIWEEDVGDIPEGLTLDHICERRICVGLHHLDLVPMSENSLRRWHGRHPDRPTVGTS